MAIQGKTTLPLTGWKTYGTIEEETRCQRLETRAFVDPLLFPLMQGDF
jgi:hypothetical protein